MPSRIKDRLHIIYYNDSHSLSVELAQTILPFYPNLEISRENAVYYNPGSRIDEIVKVAAICKYPTIIDFREAEEDYAGSLSDQFRSFLRPLEVTSPVMILTPTDVIIRYPKAPGLKVIEKENVDYNFSVATFAFFNKAFNLNCETCGDKGSYLYLPSTSVSSSFDSAKAIETLKNHGIPIERWNPRAEYKDNIVGVVIVPERTNPGFGFFGVGIETGIKEALIHGRNVLVMCPNTYAISKPVSLELIPGLAARTSFKRSGMIVWNSLGSDVLLRNAQPSPAFSDPWNSPAVSDAVKEEKSISVSSGIFDVSNSPNTQTQESARSLLICAPHLGLV